MTISAYVFAREYDPSTNHHGKFVEIVELARDISGDDLTKAIFEQERLLREDYPTGSHVVNFYYATKLEDLFAEDPTQPRDHKLTKRKASELLSSKT